MLLHFKCIPDGKKAIILKLKLLARFSKLSVFNVKGHAVLNCKQEISGNIIFFTLLKTT